MDKTSQKNAKIILSADDFGAGSVANKNILELASSAKIDRVAIMTSGNISQTEIKKILSLEIKLDIHLDMQDKINKKRKLKDGVTWRIIFFIVDFLTGKISSQRIRLLWEKQIADFKLLFGRYPDGLNSHQHIHFFPPYFKIALELSQKYNIPFIRFGYKPSNKSNLIAFILNFLKRFDRGYLRNIPASSTDFMLSADWIENFDFKKYIDKINSTKSVEIIFHPERKEEFYYLKNNPRLGGN